MRKKLLVLPLTLLLLLSSLVAISIAPTLSGVLAQSTFDPQLLNIDVFTNRGGVGANVNSSTFAPQETVKMYGNVTYRSISLVNQDVAFSVRNSSGALIAVRVARTNSSGIALADYRLPLSMNNSMASFGTWLVSGSVNVTQVVLSDKTYFTYGYLSQISSQTVKALSSVHRLENFTVNATIGTLNNSTAWSELDITLLDQAQVPIGSYTIKHTSATDNGNITASIQIPQWAFTGPATAYLCLLATDGIALAPECLVNFEILA